MCSPRNSFDNRQRRVRYTLERRGESARERERERESRQFSFFSSFPPLSFVRTEKKKNIFSASAHSFLWRRNRKRRGKKKIYIYIYDTTIILLSTSKCTTNAENISVQNEKRSFLLVMLIFSLFFTKCEID